MSLNRRAAFRGALLPSVLALALAACSGGPNPAGGALPSLLRAFDAPAGAGRYRIVYRFEGSLADSNGPPEGPPLLDKAGDVFGVLVSGGGGPCGDGGCGSVYELVPNSTGRLEQHTVYAFQQNLDGDAPYGPLAWDGRGGLFGATNSGGGSGACGPDGCGIVYHLAPSPGGKWRETVIHRFAGSPGDGGIPWSGILRGKDGALYGTTIRGGKTDGGTVFRLAVVGGKWTETVLHSFTGKDGFFPMAGLVADRSGDLYGTTNGGGTAGCANIPPISGCGVVFEMVKTAGGFTEKTLYGFTGAADGGEPAAPLVVDANGSLYETTSWGIVNQSARVCGSVFRLDPAGAKWKIAVLHTFSCGYYDPQSAYAGLALLGDKLYGATTGGGAYGAGAMFEISTTGAHFKTLHDFGNGSDADEGPSFSFVPWTSGSSTYLFDVAPGGKYAPPHSDGVVVRYAP